MKIKKLTTVQQPLISPVLQYGQRPKKRLLSAALTGIVLCSVSIIAHANEVSVVEKPTYTLKVLTEEEEIVTPQKISVQPFDNKAVTQIPTKQEAPTTYKRNIKLKNGGMIWVSKDPTSLTPTLDVKTSKNVEIVDGKFTSPLTFKITTNYAYFIDNWELSVYDSSDDDLLNPIALFLGRDLKNGRLIKWNGKLTTGKKLEVGSKLKYVLRVRNKSGHLDETRVQLMQLKGPNRYIKTENKDFITSNNISGDNNSLARQTIPLHGSRIRIFGQNIPRDTQISINGEKISLVDNKFVTEKLLPTGDHQLDVEIRDNKNNTYHEALNVHLKDKYMFMVGLADVTFGKGKVTGNLESLSDGDKHLDGDIFVDGRLAFYLKGKIKGKYLVTAQMDTGTAPIEDLFDNIHKKDPRSLFRRLDPDKYYPVYGDDSTLIDDTDSQGKMYVRVDWDKSRALWGNYNTDFTGTELSSFNRSLYGGKVSHKSTKTTKNGDHKTDLTVFASEAQSAFRHNQFLGTGGSLYYLKDTDIVDGSEKVWVEVRQRESDRAVKTIVLEEGRDYEIDDFQGRIILHRPLLQITKQSGPSLVKDNPLDGDQVYLMVDYEYVPNDFVRDKASFGTRGKVWLNDTFAVGATFARESRVDDDYQLKGVDITLKKGKGTYIQAEYAESESTQTQGSFLSQDGGLNFSDFNDNNAASDISGSAYSLEARADLQNIISLSGSIGAWFKNRDAGFSTARFNDATETTDIGVEGRIVVNERVGFKAKVTSLEKVGVRETTTASIQGDYRVNNKINLGAEIRHIKEKDKLDISKNGKGTLGAFKVGFDLNKDINLYAIAQATIAQSGFYEDNDLFTLGTKAKINKKIDFNAEISTGDRGDSALLGVNYRISNDYRVYTNYRLSTDRTDDKRSTITVGQRKSVTNRLKVYTEHQFTHQTKQSGVGHTFGLDYGITKQLVATASVQTARLDKADSGLTDRDAFSVGLNYKRYKTKASTRLESRRDKGVNENTKQWVSTNRINYRVNPSLRLQGKFNYSETKDQRGNTRDARFSEAALGFALRPVKHDRLNILGRLSYLYDLQPLSQSTRADEKALIASLESSYQLNSKWEIGGKLAHKSGQIRSDRNTGSWEKNDATLAAVRARYHLTHKWDAMAEYHWMNSEQSQDTKQGVMMSIDRHISKNMKLGIGYNFTDFDDDLTRTTGTAKGWFINLVGKY